MQIQELLKEMSYSEFSNLAVGLSGAGEIKEERIPSVISSVNGALLRLYSKFLFRHKQVVIKKLAGQTVYVIDSKYSESQGATDPFIMDVDDPFKDDILKIISIHYRAPETNEFLDVDRRFRHKPITVDVPRTVRLPDEVPVGEWLWVNYRASHPKVDYDENTYLECPPSAYEAIKAYVAYKEYSNLNTDTGIAKGTEHLNYFNLLCEEMVDRDTIGVTEEFTDNRFSDRGYT